MARRNNNPFEEHPRLPGWFGQRHGNWRRWIVPVDHPFRANFLPEIRPTKGRNTYVLLTYQDFNAQWHQRPFPTELRAQQVRAALMACPPWAYGTFADIERLDGMWRELLDAPPAGKVAA